MAEATGKLRQDILYRMAKEQGYRSRAAIKLLQLNNSFRLLPTARAVLDLGAAPGGWLQVAVRCATPGAFIVGVDLARIRPIRGAISLTEDITDTARCSAAVRRLMDSKGVTAFDLVLHDGVGQKKKRKRDDEEATRQSALIIGAVRLATMFLAPKGAFITKFVGPYDFKAVMCCLRQLFEKVEAVKPVAVRSTLPELYIVCLEYKAPAKIQPEHFDLKHLLTMSKHGKELRAVDSAELEMEDGIRDGWKEETQTHSGSNEEIDSDEQHRYERMIHGIHEGFTIKNGKLEQQQHKHVNPSNPYANADLLEPKEYVVAKKKVHVRDCKGKALVDPLNDGNTSEPKKKVGEEDAKRARGKRVPHARKMCIPGKAHKAGANHVDMTPAEMYS